MTNILRIIFVFISFCIISTVINCASKLPEPVFKSHPRLAYTTDEINAWKADAKRSAEITHLRERSDILLKQGLTVPTLEGNWYFYYACPKDGARLNPESLERHVCPVCHAVYTDERTQASYRTILNDQLNDACYTLALTYALTGEVKYAEPVIKALCELARLYPTWEHHDRWGRRGLLAVVGGWRYAQLLDESYTIIILAKAYDLISDAPNITAEQRNNIEQNLLKRTVENVMKFQIFAGSKNNHQTWFNASYVTVGVAIGDKSLINAGINGAHGFLWQMKESVTDDGLWYEGTMSYQRYAMLAIIQTLDSCARVGWNFADNKRLRSMWLGPISMAYPNGQFPVFHDSDPGSVYSWSDFYRYGYSYFKDKRFLPYTGEATTEKAEQLNSSNLSSIGIAALRDGLGEKAICAMIDYGQHGDHHGHPDKLNLVLYAMGNEILLDPGRITYSVPEYETWCRTTLAHNTVVLNGENQQPDTGKMLYFHTDKEYSAALMESTGAYPGNTMRRFVILKDNILIDFFLVIGEKEQQTDWVMHARGGCSIDMQLSPLETLGKTSGYQHITDIQSAPGTTQFKVSGQFDKDKKYVIWCDGDSTSTIFTGKGIGYSLNERVPMMIRRRTAQATLFTTVYDLSGNRTAVKDMKRLPLQIGNSEAKENEAIALQIAMNNGTLTVACDLRINAKTPIKLDGTKIDRCLVIER